MKLGLKDAVKSRQGTKKLNGFGKAWEVGDQLKCFYPIFRDENGVPNILTASVWGHQVNDFEGFGLGATFIPTTCEINERGEIVGSEDVTYMFSRIAKAYIVGKKQAEINKAKVKFASDPDMLQTKLNAIEQKYDTKQTIDAEKPVIGPLTNVVTTEVIAVKCSEGKPVKDAVPMMVTQSISDARAAKLNQFLSDSRYAPKEGEDYLEVEYSFTATSGKKSDAGRVDPQPVSSECKLSFIDPDFFKSVEVLIPLFASESEIMENRNFQFKQSSLTKVMNCIKMYAIENSEYLEELPADMGEAMIKNAKRIKELQIPVPENLKSKINEELGGEELAVQQPQEPEFVSGAPSYEDLLLQEQTRLTEEEIDGMNNYDITAPLS